MSTNSYQEVDPELREVLRNFPNTELNEQTLETQREVFRKLRPSVISTAEGWEIKARKIPGPPNAPEVTVHTYVPSPLPSSKVPAFLWMHGGAYVLGQAGMDYKRLVGIATELNIVIVDVDYRLAPEHPFPAGIEDCYAALKWMNQNADTLGIDVNRIAVGGSSAGGTLAAALSLMVRDKNEFKLSLQILVYPALDDRDGVREGLHPKYGVSANLVKYAWRTLLGKFKPGSDEVSPYAAPLRAKSFAGLPPAYIPIGELDILRNECVAYAQRLWDAGVSAELHIIPGAFHGFDMVAAAYISQSLETHIKYVLKRELLSKQ